MNNKISMMAVSICALTALVMPQFVQASEPAQIRREIEKLSFDYHKTSDENEAEKLFEKIILKFMDLKNAGDKVTEAEMFQLCRNPDATHETDGSNVRVYYHPTKQNPKKVFLVLSSEGVVESVTVNLYKANDFSGFKEYVPSK